VAHWMTSIVDDLRHEIHTVHFHVVYSHKLMNSLLVT
jgi:hypothetical protein